MKISAFGDLPLYKSHEFERSIEKWVRKTMEKRE